MREQTASRSLWLTGVLFTALLMLAGAYAPVRAGEAPAPVNIVLVHGIFDTGKIFDSMIRRLNSAGFNTFAPALSPNSGISGMEPLARQLSQRIDAHFGPSQPIVLIGFSMGGLVTRYYVQNLAERRRVRAVFLISTPDHGTLWACFAPWKGMRDMALGSGFVRALNADRTQWEKIPVSSYWTPLDLMIVPATSSRWETGKTTRILCPLHALMVKNRTVNADILTRIKALKSNQSPARRSRGRPRDPGGAPVPER